MDDDDFLLDLRKPGSKKTDPSFDDFVDLEAEPGIGFHKGGSTPTVRHFHELKIDEKFFRLPHERKDKLNPPLDFPAPQARLFVKELNLSWKMFGGVDFPIVFEPMRMDRTLKGMQIPRSKSQREAGAMVDLRITKFRLKQ